MRVNKALTDQDQDLGESIFTSASGFIGESNMVKHR